MTDPKYIEVPATFPVRITDFAHHAEDAESVGHTEGFCLACAHLAVAINRALIEQDLWRRG